MLFDLQIFSGGVYPPSATSRTISFSISNSFWYYISINHLCCDLLKKVKPVRKWYFFFWGGGGGGGAIEQVTLTLLPDAEKIPAIPFQACKWTKYARRSRGPYGEERNQANNQAGIFGAEGIRLFIPGRLARSPLICLLTRKARKESFASVRSKRLQTFIMVSPTQHLGHC